MPCRSVRSQHQKLFVVDDALAFSGGLDLTQRRWDTSDHKPSDTARIGCDRTASLSTVSRRADHGGWRGSAGARASGAPPLVQRATGPSRRSRHHGDPWPRERAPHFKARRRRHRPHRSRRSKTSKRSTRWRRFFLDSIDRAEHSIYIENQFMTALPVAERLARRLRQRPNLEVVAVSPQTFQIPDRLADARRRAHPLLENPQARRRRPRPAGLSDGRGRTASADTMVHSKVMIVDDRLLRVGSANLNNRSMGVDTECDLAIEAKDDSERAAIADVRNRLLGDHCGVCGGAVASALAEPWLARRCSGSAFRQWPQAAARSTMASPTQSRAHRTVSRLWSTRKRSATFAAVGMRRRRFDADGGDRSMILSRACRCAWR